MVRLQEKLLREWIRLQLSEAASGIPDAFTPALVKSLAVSGGNGLLKGQKFFDNPQGTAFSDLIDAYNNSTQKNDGEMFEDAMVAYGLAHGRSTTRLGKEGQDLEIDGKTYEVKKSQSSSPNTMFNSTFPKANPNHYYIFLLNALSTTKGFGVAEIQDIDAFIVPSMEIRKILLQSTFQELPNLGAGLVYDEASLEMIPSGHEAVIDLIQTKLETMDLPARIAQKLGSAGGPLDVSQQLELPFMKGEGVQPQEIDLGGTTSLDFGVLKVRIRLMIEPRSRKT